MTPENKSNQPSPAENHLNEEEVARRAYEFYEARKREPGHELDDWLDAEQEVNKRRQFIHKQE